MMLSNSTAVFVTIEQFNAARREAQISEILGKLTGRNTRLLSYEEVRRKLRAVETGTWELKEIPLDAIVGSVGRFDDFTRDFLPRLASDRDRWVRVMRAVTSLQGLPPIEVYQVGDVYFVHDGNHRVSVAKRLGAKTIQAYVRQVQVRVPVSPADDVEDYIIKAEYADFLEDTRLDIHRPGINLHTTQCCQYEVLRQQIEVYQFVLEMQQGQPVSLETAASAWYQEIYEPLAKAIREHNLSETFPGQTETDLFLWLVEHHAELGRELGWNIRPHSVVHNLVERYGTARRGITGIWANLWDLLRQGSRKFSPTPGDWRRHHLADFSGRLFSDIMAVVYPAEDNWLALDFALQAARSEAGRVLGVMPAAKPEQAAMFSAVFREKCAAAGIEGQLAQDGAENLPELVAERCQWVDLVVLPVPSDPKKKKAAGLEEVLSQALTPVLLVGADSQATWAPAPKRAMLVFDGSLNGREALFMAAYLTNFWDSQLTVLAIDATEKPMAGPEEPSPLAEAQTYLDNLKISAEMLSASKEVVHETIRKAAEDGEFGLLILPDGQANLSTEETTTTWYNTFLPQPVLICK